MRIEEGCKELFERQTRQCGAVYTSNEACRSCPTDARITTRRRKFIWAAGQFMCRSTCAENPRYLSIISRMCRRIPPSNHFGRRKQNPAQVRLTIRRDPGLMPFFRDFEPWMGNLGVVSIKFPSENCVFGRTVVSMSENAIETPPAPTKKILKNQKDFRPTCRMIQA